MKSRKHHTVEISDPGPKALRVRTVTHYQEHDPVIGKVRKCIDKYIVALAGTHDRYDDGDDRS